MPKHLSLLIPYSFIFFITWADWTDFPTIHLYPFLCLSHSCCFCPFSPFLFSSSISSVFSRQSTLLACKCRCWWLRPSQGWHGNQRSAAVIVTGPTIGKVWPNYTQLLRTLHLLITWPASSSRFAKWRQDISYLWKRCWIRDTYKVGQAIFSHFNE